MYKEAKIFYIYTETPLHAGSGSELGTVDLPIQREKHTDYPIIHSSSLKGAVRSAFETFSERVKQEIKQQLLKKILKDGGKYEIGQEEKILKKWIELTFGPEDGDKHSGSLTFTDAKILLFPVKSLKGVFAYITSPFVLRRFKRDLEIARVTTDFDVPQIEDGKAGISKNNGKCDVLVSNSQLVLEEYTFEAMENESDKANAISGWISENVIPKGNEYNYWREKVKTSLAVISDNDFKDFARLSTEVVARVKLKQETKTVDKGALWYEENLPSDTVMYSLALASPVLVEGNSFDLQEATDVLSFFSNAIPDRIQIGGNETIGRGIVSVHIQKCEEGGK